LLFLRTGKAFAAALHALLPLLLRDLRLARHAIAMLEARAIEPAARFGLDLLAGFDLHRRPLGPRYGPARTGEALGAPLDALFLLHLLARFVSLVALFARLFAIGLRLIVAATVGPVLGKRGRGCGACE